MSYTPLSPGSGLSDGGGPASPPSLSPPRPSSPADLTAQSPAPPTAPAPLAPQTPTTASSLFCRGHSGDVKALAVLPHGDLLSVGTGGGVIVQSRDAQFRSSFKGHATDVLCVAALGGNVVVTGDDDGILTLWDVQTRETLKRCRLVFPVTAVVRVDERRFAIGLASADPCVQIWCHYGGRRAQLVCTLDYVASDVITALAVDWRKFLHVASTNMTVCVYDIGNLSVRPPLVHTLARHNEAVNCVATDLRWAASGDAGGCVAIRCVESKRLMRFFSIHRLLGSPVLNLSRTTCMDVPVTAVLVFEDTLVFTCSHPRSRWLVFCGLPSANVIARERLEHEPTSLALLPPDRIALGFTNGNLCIVPIPSCVPHARSPLPPVAQPRNPRPAHRAGDIEDRPGKAFKRRRLSKSEILAVTARYRREREEDQAAVALLRERRERLEREVVLLRERRERREREAEEAAEQRVRETTVAAASDVHVSAQEGVEEKAVEGVVRTRGDYDLRVVIEARRKRLKRFGEA